MLKEGKCITCKKYRELDGAPWIACSVYPEHIPLSIYQNPIDSDQPINCDKYEKNHDWDKNETAQQ